MKWKILYSLGIVMMVPGVASLLYLFFYLFFWWLSLDPNDYAAEEIRDLLPLRILYLGLLGLGTDIILLIIISMGIGIFGAATVKYAAGNAPKDSEVRRYSSWKTWR